MHAKICDARNRSMPTPMSTWDSIYLRRQVHSSTDKNVFVEPGEGVDIRLVSYILRAVFWKMNLRSETSGRIFIYKQIWISPRVKRLLNAYFNNYINEINESHQLVINNVLCLIIHWSLSILLFHNSLVMVWIGVGFLRNRRYVY